MFRVSVTSLLSRMNRSSACMEMPTARATAVIKSAMTAAGRGTGCDKYFWTKGNRSSGIDNQPYGALDYTNRAAV